MIYFFDINGTPTAIEENFASQYKDKRLLGVSDGKTYRKLAAEGVPLNEALDAEFKVAEGNIVPVPENDWVVIDHDGKNVTNTQRANKILG